MADDIPQELVDYGPCLPGIMQRLLLQIATPPTYNCMREKPFLCMDVLAALFLSRFLSRKFIRPAFPTINISEERGAVELDNRGTATCQPRDTQVM